MTKKRARVKYIILAIFVVIGILLSVCQFNIPFTDYTYNGFARSISLGLDLSGGISAVYDCSLNTDSGTSDLDSAIQSTVTRLESILYSEGYSEATVTKQGSSKIRIEVPNLSDSEELFAIIGEPASLYMTTDSNFDVNNPTGEYVSGQEIESVNPNYDKEKSSFGVVLDFNKEGGDKFASITEEAASGDQKIYVFIGDDDPLTLETTSKITGGSTFISGGSISDYESAKEYALMIMSGTFSAKLEMVECTVVSATLGSTALLYGLIAGAVAMAIVMLIMWWRYGRLGLIADFALVIYLILMLFFLQAIPFIQLTLPGIAGIILSLGMAVDGNVIIFERIREEFAKGKKLHLAVKSGFKRAFWPIFDSNITTIVTSVVLYILGTASIKGFALTLLLGIVLSMFTTLVVTRILTKWAIPFNANKPHKMHLKRDENVVEIEDDEDKNNKDKGDKKPEIVVEG